MNGGMRTIGGVAGFAFGAGMSSTGIGASIGVPMAWSFDPSQADELEAVSGQPRTSLGGQGIQSLAGNGTGGQILTGAYDTLPGLAIAGYAIHAGAKGLPAYWGRPFQRVVPTLRVANQIASKGPPRSVQTIVLLTTEEDNNRRRRIS